MLLNEEDVVCVRFAGHCVCAPLAFTAELVKSLLTRLAQTWVSLAIIFKKEIVKS